MYLLVSSIKNLLSNNLQTLLFSMLQPAQTLQPFGSVITSSVHLKNFDWRFLLCFLFMPLPIYLIFICIQSFVEINRQPTSLLVTPKIIPLCSCATYFTRKSQGLQFCNSQNYDSLTSQSNTRMLMAFLCQLNCLEDSISTPRG